jgi:hypothetical protein
MNVRAVAGILAAGAAWLLTSGNANATSVCVRDAGSAVTVVNRSATFDVLATSGHALSDYLEGGLKIATDADNWAGTGSPVFDPFHGADAGNGGFYCPDGGSPGWTEITTSPTARKMYAVEFLYGNGWTTGDIYGQYPWGNSNAVVQWQTWRGGVMVSSGVEGAGWLLPVGTVIGFYDPAGFDRLLVKCTIANSSPPDYQVLAMDNLRVQTICPADFDASGSLQVQDIFAFLNAWFASDPSSDFNRVDGIGVPDIFDFLSAWFAGCN